MKPQPLLKIEHKLKRKTIPVNMRAYETLAFACTLGFMGGYLDAYSYIDRDGIFVATQSANIILMGISLSHGQFFEALSKFFPVLAFIGGIFFAQFMQKYEHYKMNNISARRLLICEFIIFVIIGGLNGKYVILTNLVLSFTTAIQFDAFKHLTHFQYSSTVAMGNLRSLSEALYFYIFRSRSTKKVFYQRQVELYSLLILSFIMGTVAGAIITNILGSMAIFGCAALVLVNLYLLYIDAN